MKKHLHDWTDWSWGRSIPAGTFEQRGLWPCRTDLWYGPRSILTFRSRARIFRSFVEELSQEKGLNEEFALYTLVERLAPKVIAEERKIYKGVSPNVDFFSGFAYSMLDLPLELYTPIFAIARIAGWSAHRLEELSYNGKIMRPAYKNVCDHREFIPMDQR